VYVQNQSLGRKSTAGVQGFTEQEVKMAKGVKFLRNGKEYTGPTHKMKDGTLHTGAKHTSNSRKLYHKDDLPKTKK